MKQFDIKTKLLFILIGAVILSILARYFEFLNARIFRYILYFAVIAVILLSGKTIMGGLGKIYEKIDEKLLRGIKKKFRYVYDIKKIRSVKSKLLNENKLLFEKELVYEKIPRKLSEIEPSFFLDEDAEPYKRVKKISDNLERISKLNSKLYDTISEFVNFTKEEQEILLNTIGYAVESGKGIENLKRFFEEHKDLSGAEIAKKLRISEEEEVNALRMVFERNKEILNNVTAFEALFQQEKRNLGHQQNIAGEILAASRDRSLRQKIIQNIKELQQKTLSATGVFAEQTENILKISKSILSEKVKVEAEVEKETKKLKETLITEKKLKLLSKTVPIGEELNIPVPSGNETKIYQIKDMLSLIKFVLEGGLGVFSFDKIMDETKEGHAALPKFVRSLGGEKLADLIKSKVTGRGEEGVEQLYNLLVEYFNLDPHTYALKRFK